MQPVYLYSSTCEGYLEVSSLTKRIKRLSVFSSMAFVQKGRPIGYLNAHVKELV